MADLSTAGALHAEEVIELGRDRPDGAAPIVLRRHTSGSGGRLLLLHGLATSARVWRDFLARAPEGVEVWTADLPWRGEGVPGWSRGDVVGAVGGALDGVPGGVDWVVAHSFTSTLLLTLLSREAAEGANQPGAANSRGIRGIVFATPLYRQDPAEFTWDTISTYLNDFHQIMREGVQVHAKHRMDPAVALDLGLRVRDAIGPYGWTRFFQIYLDTPWLRPQAVTVPSLVLTGSEDATAPTAEGRALADALPGARAHDFPGCGHFVMTERAAEFAAEVTAFLHDTSTTNRTRSALERQT